MVELSVENALRTGTHEDPGRAERIVVDGLRKSYPRADAVRGISFEVAAGQVYGLIGPNGAGKTTTLECIAGLRQPTSGTIRVHGLDPRTDRAALRRLLAVQPQDGALFPNLRVGETVRLWSSFYERPLEVDAVLAEVGLADQADQKVKALSGGQRRRLLLAVCVVGRPRVLVLDEPASGLDPSARELLWNVVRDRRKDGCSVLLTTHDMTEAAELSDRIGVIVGGSLVASGAPADLIREFGGFSTVSFTTDLPAGVTAVRRLPYAGSVKTDYQGDLIRVQVRTARGDDVLRHVASTPDLHATDLSIAHGGLDDVFKRMVAAAESEEALDER